MYEWKAVFIFKQIFDGLAYAIPLVFLLRNDAFICTLRRSNWKNLSRNHSEFKISLFNEVNKFDISRKAFSISGENAFIFPVQLIAITLLILIVDCYQIYRTPIEIQSNVDTTIKYYQYKE